MSGCSCLRFLSSSHADYLVRVVPMMLSTLLPFSMNPLVLHGLHVIHCRWSLFVISLPHSLSPSPSLPLPPSSSLSPSPSLPPSSSPFSRSHPFPLCLINTSTSKRMSGCSCLRFPSFSHTYVSSLLWILHIAGVSLQTKHWSLFVISLAASLYPSLPPSLPPSPHHPPSLGPSLVPVSST